MTADTWVAIIGLAVVMVTGLIRLEGRISHMSADITWLKQRAQQRRKSYE